MPVARELASAEAKGFRKVVEELSGQPVSRCYQCGKCTAGCPVAPEMGTDPARVMRLVQLGQKERVLSDESIWLCASCETCAGRCPQEFDLLKVMDALRAVAGREGFAKGMKGTSLLNRLFLAEIKQRGRVHEMSLVAHFNLSSGRPLADATKGPMMLLKGKLKMAGERSSSLAEVRRIFERVQEMEGLEL